MSRPATSRCALALVAAALSGGAVFAEPCPVSDDAAVKAGHYALAVEEAINAAPDCDRAFRVLDACQLGSSGDNSLSDVVVAKCEGLFLGKADAATKTAYHKAQVRCDAIALHNSGSMYQSFAAVCRARASRDFAHKRGRAN